jgi:hypothetical protein
MSPRRECLVTAFALLASLAITAGCHSTMSHSAPTRDINAVLADHDQELLANPGVVGVCVALLPDNRTQCLKVMLARDDKELKRRLPRTLEGYPVVAEVTGEFHPMQ